jgi:predicted RNA binding protein YcfA (HicA-like mRNA interferase family)
MTTLSRKTIVKVLRENGFVGDNRNSSSHHKYKKCVEGKNVTTIINEEKYHPMWSICRVSKQTGIPVEVFMRNRGSKKFKNGNGNVFSLYGNN